MNLYIFENRDEALNLEPISLTRPTFDLRCGAFTFLERIRKLFPGADIGVFVRDELSDITKERFPDLEVNPEVVLESLWLNAPVLWDKESIDEMSSSNNTVFYSEGRFVAAHLDKANGHRWLENGGPTKGVLESSLPSKKVSVAVMTYLWDCVNLNDEAIVGDSMLFNLGRQGGEVDDGARLINKSNIYLGKESRVKGGAFLDAEEGPIIMGKKVTVLPGAYLQGPLAIGDSCLIKVGAKIYGGTTIGPGCKIGGEIGESIFQSYTNKQHDGFIGHSYIGEWVNLGADTNNSDLKNNYSPIRVMVNGQVIDTGSLFVGLLMGDHTKTGISTMFNTGTSVGPAANIVGYGYPPRLIPPFSWVVNGKRKVHQLDKFIKTARMVKERRQQIFSASEEQFYRQLFKTASKEISN